MPKKICFHETCFSDSNLWDVLHGLFQKKMLKVNCITVMILAIAIRLERSIREGSLEYYFLYF